MYLYLSVREWLLNSGSVKYHKFLTQVAPMITSTVRFLILAVEDNRSHKDNDNKKGDVMFSFCMKSPLFSCIRIMISSFTVGHYEDLSSINTVHTGVSDVSRHSCSSSCPFPFLSGRLLPRACQVYEQSTMAEAEPDRAVLPPGGAGLSAEAGEAFVASAYPHISKYIK